MKPSLKYIIEPNRPIEVLMTIGCLMLWFPDFVKLNLTDIVSFPIYLPYYIEINILKIIALIVTMLLSIINGFLISSFIYRLSISWTRSAFPLNLYLLSVGVLPELHTQIGVQIALLLFVGTLFILYGTFRKQEPVEEAFLSTLFLSVACFFIPNIIFFLPLLWSIYIFLQFFSIRVWLSSVIGMIIVFLFLGTYIFLTDSWSLFAANIHELLYANFNFLHISELTLQHAYMGVLLIYGVICIIAFYSNYFQYGVQTRTILSIFSVLFFLFFPFILFKPTVFTNIFIIWICILNCFCSYFFISKQNWFRYIIFGVYVIIHLSYFVIINFQQLTN